MAISSVQGEQMIYEPSRAAVVAPPAREPAPDSSFVQAVRRLGREIDAGEVTVARASQLHNYDSASLIALQAGIYRYTEAVDLASKIVDRASSAVRTVLSGGGH